jgi:hypothetical protein
MKYLLTVIVMVIGLTGYSQSFNYAYYDPCDGNLKSVAVPVGQNTIAVTYFNQVKSFDVNDFSNGVFNTWVNNTYNTYKTISPCNGVGFTNITQQNQGISVTLVGIINTISTLSFPDPNTPDPNEPTPTPDVTGGDGEDNISINTPNKDNSGSEGGGGGSKGGVGSEDRGSEEEGGSDVMSGTSKSVTSVSGSSKSNNTKSNNQKQNALKPTIVGSSDLVVFNNSDNSRGGKISGGYTLTRWDGLRTHGLLFDYSTQINGPNITGFYGWIGKRKTTLLSNTLSIGFEGKGSLYSSIAFGQLRNLNHIKIIYMVSSSYGHVYQQRLIGTSLIVGGMYDFKIAKIIGIKLTNLLIYSPYMQYYNDVLLKSPLVLLPSIGTNVSITKNFKINLNLGGAYQIKTGALNYSLIVGSRIAL